MADAMMATVLPFGARMSIRIDGISDKLHRMQIYDILAEYSTHSHNVMFQPHSNPLPL